MGGYTESDNVVLLFDNYSSESEKLHTSFKMTGKDYPVAVIEDDGFLPEGVISVYGYFLGEFKKGENVPGRPRYFNQIKVPKYWEISANNTNGKIHNLNKERGRIFYAAPAHKRLVKAVDWLNEDGIVRSTDHYNRQGALYARTTFNAKGQKVNKSYFDVKGREIIVENYVTRDIILNDGDVVRIFKSLTDFVCFFMKRAGFEGKRIFFNTLSTSFFVSQRMPAGEKGDILFWQEEERPDIPGNMQIILNGQAARAEKIMVQKKAAYEKLLKLGASAKVLHKLGYVYPFKKQNGHGKHVLICTNSDRIAKCKELVEALPNLHFHIVALTEMSAKLTAMGGYDNVSLYPGVKPSVAEELFEKCDMYLDINYEGEILDGVQTAFLHNHLIFAFRETMHNAKYVAEEHIYAVDDVGRMMDAIKAISNDEDSLERHLSMQQKTALLETKEAYLMI